MKLEERQKEILEQVIRDYIELAQPISSEYLKERHKLDVSPATIRAKMQDLTELGYLVQPHTSAGRVPTDKGYRYFVDEIVNAGSGNPGRMDLDFAAELEAESQDLFRLAELLTRDLAFASSSLALSYIAEEEVLIRNGWEQVLKNPEFVERDAVSNLIDFMAHLEKNLDELVPESGLDICIGRENACPKADDFSLITFKYEPKNREAIILSLVGPKRMAYDKNIGLVNRLLNFFETQ